MQKKKINVILFDDFTLLDVFGPVEVLSFLKEFTIEFFSMKGGKIKTAPNLGIMTKPISKIRKTDALLIPGGWGTRKQVNNKFFIHALNDVAEKSKYCLTVCTGSALLAKTGLLNGLKATSNKIAFNWVTQQNRSINWQRKARWVVDGKYYTSSGVTAGIDMALGFVSDQFGVQKAHEISQAIEYVRNSKSEHDPFCKKACKAKKQKVR